MTGPNKAILINKKKLTNKVIELTFKHEGLFKAKAGQFINIKIEDKEKFPCFRAYSFSSLKKNEFKLCVTIIENGRGSSFLNNLKIGNEIFFIGPSGKFNITNNTTHTFIATGSGIAPIKAIIEKIKNKNQTINLFFGLRNEEDIYYDDFFQNIKNEKFNYILSLSSPSEKWTREKGRVSNYLNEKQIKNFKKSSFYICGNPEMVKDCEEILLKKGIDQTNIITEKY